MVVYHGTNADFTKLDLKIRGSNADNGIFGRGFYISKNINTSMLNEKTTYDIFIISKKSFLKKITIQKMKLVQN